MWVEGTVERDFWDDRDAKVLWTKASAEMVSTYSSLPDTFITDTHTHIHIHIHTYRHTHTHVLHTHIQTHTHMQTETN